MQYAVAVYRKLVALFLRSGHLNVEYAGTRPLSEAKRVRVPIVLPWVTRLEGGMSLLFYLHLWDKSLSQIDHMSSGRRTFLRFCIVFVCRRYVRLLGRRKVVVMVTGLLRSLYV
ncbi:hypothetical protein Naga_100005g111 [Nannochloropsis gaditana]|uniref:Uncharacterized protein n=1 Tax=Nannochloropsis gaditana TaxID=72520 RepID=W7TPH3_9STRA|nr:hypothetical protein Naga_100005g111 [Nannochloropsis gaditana]